LDPLWCERIVIRVAALAEDVRDGYFEARARCAGVGEVGRNRAAVIVAVSAMSKGLSLASLLAMCKVAFLCPEPPGAKEIVKVVLSPFAKVVAIPDVSTVKSATCDPSRVTAITASSTSPALRTVKARLAGALPKLTTLTPSVRSLPAGCSTAISWGRPKLATSARPVSVVNAYVAEVLTPEPLSVQFKNT
jgi:hypothetical protein